MMRRRQLRRLHWIFAIVVVTAFVSAFLAERSRPDERPSEGFGSVVVARLEGPVLERGDLTVHGIVVDHAGAPAADVRIQAWPLGGDPAALEPFFFGRTGPEGTFELRHLRAGTYRVVLLRAGTRTSERELALPADGPLLWRLEEPWEDLPAAPDLERVPIEGRIACPAFDGEGRDLAGYEVLFVPRGEEALWRGAQERRATTDAEGRFAVPDLAAAEHDLLVLPPWARGGSWPVLARLPLDAGAPPEAGAEASGTLVVGLAVGRIEGWLADPRGRPIEGALLRCRPVGEGAERAWPAASSDAEGRFVLRDLPAPPEGRLYAVEVFAGAARREAQVEVVAGRKHEVRFGPLETRLTER